MENSHSRATTLPPSLCTYPLLAPTPTESPLWHVRYLCISPTPSQNLLPPPPIRWYRMCGNVATVKYIKTSGRGDGGGYKKELATCTTFKSGRNPVGLSAHLCTKQQKTRVAIESRVNLERVYGERSARQKRRIRGSVHASLV